MRQVNKSTIILIINLITIPNGEKCEDQILQMLHTFGEVWAVFMRVYWLANFEEKKY